MAQRKSKFSVDLDEVEQTVAQQQSSNVAQQQDSVVVNTTGSNVANNTTNQIAQPQALPEVKDIRFKVTSIKIEESMLKMMSYIKSENDIDKQMIVRAALMDFIERYYDKNLKGLTPDGVGRVRELLK